MNNSTPTHARKRCPMCYSATHKGRIPEHTLTPHSTAMRAPRRCGRRRRMHGGCPAWRHNTSTGCRSMHIYAHRESVPRRSVHFSCIVALDINPHSHRATMDRKKRTTQKPASSSRRDKTLPLPSPNSGSRTSASPEQPIVPPLGDSTSMFVLSPRGCIALSDTDGRFDERWDVYFHAFLLHETKHSDCYYYKDRTYKESGLVPTMTNQR